MHKKRAIRKAFYRTRLLVATQTRPDNFARKLPFWQHMPNFSPETEKMTDVILLINIFRCTSASWRWRNLNRKNANKITFYSISSAFTVKQGFGTLLRKTHDVSDTQNESIFRLASRVEAPTIWSLWATFCYVYIQFTPNFTIIFCDVKKPVEFKNCFFFSNVQNCISIQKHISFIW